MPAPRSGYMEKVQFKLPPSLLESVDQEVEDGNFQNRSDFFRHLTEAYFTEKETLADLDSTVQKRISEGRYDEALGARISKILAQQLLKK